MKRRYLNEFNKNNYPHICFDSILRPNVSNHYHVDTSVLLKAIGYRDYLDKESYVYIQQATLTLSENTLSECYLKLYDKRFERNIKNLRDLLNHPNKRFVIFSHEKYTPNKWQEDLKRDFPLEWDELLRNVELNQVSRQDLLSLVIAKIEGGEFITRDDGIVKVGEALKVKVHNFEKIVKSLPRFNKSWKEIIQEYEKRVEGFDLYQVYQKKNPISIK